MNYAFVTGMGRSGTKFLAELFKEISNVHAQHEYIGDREFWLLSWYLSTDQYVNPYLIREKKAIEKIYKDGLFIDVNGKLQNCVPELENIFNPRKIFHFVRDPRAVVRSLYARRDEKNIHLIPKTKVEIEKWLDSDKFYKICWNWKTTTEKLLSENTTLIRFEDISSDYDNFNKKILEPLQLTIAENQWRNIVKKKVNETKSKFYRRIYAGIRGKTFIEDELPIFDEWSDLHKNKFFEVCGETMRKCGYL